MGVVAIYLIYLLTLLILAVYSVSIFRKVPKGYQPMLIFLMVTFLLEFLSFIWASNENVHDIFSNILYLSDSFLICWLAKRWQIFDRRPLMFPVVLGFLLIVWVAEYFLVSFAGDRISWFRVVCSFTITLLAIELLCRRVMVEKLPLHQSAVALFSIALIIYYSLVGLLEVFMIIGQFTDQNMLRVIFLFYIVLGLFTNFIYLRSMLCISKQANYYTS